MRPTNKRVPAFGRGIILIAVLMLAQQFTATAAAADATQCPCSLFSSAINPGDEAPDSPTPTDPAGVNLGIKFHSEVAGFVKRIRFYKHIDNTGTHTAYLWDANGNSLLGVDGLGNAIGVTFTNETATGWQEVALPTAVAISANTDYVASYYAPNRHWPHNLNYYLIFGTESSPLHVTGNNSLTDGFPRNGVFKYGTAGLFPNGTNQFHPTNYMVDVVFDTVNTVRTTGPTVVSTSPAGGALGVDPNSDITVSFSRQMNASTINSTTVQLLDAGVPVSGFTLSYPELATSPVATITTAAALQVSHTYNILVKGGTTGVKDLEGNPLAADATVSFTTAAALPSYARRTIWNQTATVGAETPDDYEATLGVKFQSSADGYIKGLLFYKSTNNTGTHHGYLWTASGTLLAKATFTNETATGWQQVIFSPAVAITRHTTYIAAYYTSSGRWVNSRPYFQQGPYVSFPLTAMQNFNQNGGNPNSVFVYNHNPFAVPRVPPDPTLAFNTPLIPNQDPNDAPTYWIDVLFDTNATDGPSFSSAAGTTFTASSPGTFTVTVTGTPVPTITSTGTLPSGVTFVDNLNRTGTLSGTAANGSGGRYPLTFTATNSGGTATQSFVLTVNEAPAITSPAVDQTTCAGSSVTFSATASGFPAPAVQWQVSTDGGVTFNNIVGQTATSYTFTTAVADNSKRYRAVFTNTSGTAQSTAILTVNDVPAITSGPADANVCANSSITFSATATNSTTVKWQRSTDGGVTFTDIPGATAASYSFVAATTDNNNRYRAVFGNTCGSATTTAAVLSVANGSPVVTSNPVSTNACANSSVTFSAAATGSASVKWQVSTDGLNFSDIAGATATSYTFVVASTDNNKQYRAVFTNVCGVSNTIAATLTVTSGVPAITANPANATACPNSSATFTATATGSTSVKWQVSSNGGTTFSDIIGATATSYTFTATATDNSNQYRAVFSNVCGTAATTAGVLTVNTAPAVTTNPTNVTTCANGSVTFNAAASGTAPTVKWQSSTDGVTYTDIAGATTTSYTFLAQAGDSGKRYQAVFANSCGTATTTAALLTVNTAPVVTGNPTNATTCATGSVTFSASASGTTSTVQWQMSADGGATFGAIAGATATTYTFTPAATDNNNQYRAVFTNSCATATTSAATLTINTAPSVTTNPANATSCDNAAVTFTAAASGSTSTVKWQSSTDGVTYTDIPLATNTTYTFTAQASDNGKRYQAVFTNSCGTATTTAALLTVNTAPLVTTNPSNATTCANSSVTLTAAASGSTSTVKWQSSTDGVTYSDIAGATTASYTFTAQASDNGKRYQAVFTNSCGTATTTAAILTVNAAPVVTTNPINATTCANNSVTFTAAASGSTSTVKWQSSTDGVTYSDIAGATSASYTFTAQASDNGKRYQAVFTNGCGTATTTAAVLTVNTAPVVTTSPSNATTCANSSVTFTATASGTSPTVKWQSSTDGVTYSDIAGATTASYTFTAQASDNGKRYQAVFTNSCGTATSTAARLTVNTAPVVTTNPSNATTCANSSVTFTAAASGSTSTVKWQSSTDGVTYSDIAGATNTSYTFTAQSSDNGKRYQAVFTNSCGTATSTAAVLTVNTAPAVTTNPSNATTCPNSSVTFTAAASGTSPTVKWQSSTDGVTYSDIAGATTASYTFTAQAGDNGKRYQAVFTNSCGTATTVPATLTVTSVGTPSITAPSIVNAGSTGNAASASATGATGYDWTITNGVITSATNIASITFSANSTSPITLTVKASNSSGCFATSSATVTVNRPPTAVADSYNVVQNSTLNVAAPGVLSNDTDPDGNVLTAVLVTGTGPANGTLTFRTDGSFQYTPNANFYGADSFKYHANDGLANSADVSVNIDVLQSVVTQSVAPGASATTDTTNTGATATNPLQTSVRVPADLIGNQAVTISTGKAQPTEVPPAGYQFLGYEVDVTAPAALTPSNPLLLTFVLDSTIIPAGQNNNSIQVTRDGGTPIADCSATAGTTATPDPCIESRTLLGSGDVSIAVRSSHASHWNFVIKTAAANTPPVGNPDTYSVCAESPLSVNAATGVLANDTDAERNTLTAILVQAPTNAQSFALNSDGSFSYTPKSGFSGADSFTYTPNDGTASGNITTATINVNAATATITASGPTTFCQGGSVTLTANAGNAYSWSNGATTQSITVSASGSYTVTVTNTSGCRATSAATTVTVNPLPDATITTPASVTSGSSGNNASCPAGATGTTYAWTITGGTITSTAPFTNTIAYTAGTTSPITIGLTVTSPAGCQSTSSKSVTVASATPPTISVDSPVQKAPLTGATALMKFTFTLSAPSSQQVTVNYNTSNATGIAGTDYVATSGTIIFPASSTTQTANVTIKGTGATTAKTFWMNMSSPTNATIALVAGFPQKGKGTINP